MFANASLHLLHTTGAKSGLARLTPLAYMVEGAPARSSGIVPCFTVVRDWGRQIALRQWRNTIRTSLQ